MGKQTPAIETRRLVAFGAGALFGALTSHVSARLQSDFVAPKLEKREAKDEVPTHLDSHQQRPRLEDHLGLIVTASTFGIIVARLLGVSGWDPQTAAAVVSAGGATNVALAVAVASVPQVASVISVPLGLTLGRLASRGGWAWVGRHLFVLAVLVLAALVLMPLAFAAAGVVAALGTVALRKFRPTPGSATSPSFAYTFPAWVVAMVITFSQSPYLPSEVFDPLDEDAYTGYIVGREEGVLVVLTEAGSMQRVSDSTPHEFCKRDSDPDILAVTAAEIGKAVPYPACPRVPATTRSAVSWDPTPTTPRRRHV